MVVLSFLNSIYNSRSSVNWQEKGEIHEFIHYKNWYSYKIYKKCSTNSNVEMLLFVKFENKCFLYLHLTETHTFCAERSTIPISTRSSDSDKIFYEKKTFDYLFPSTTVLYSRKMLIIFLFTVNTRRLFPSIYRNIFLSVVNNLLSSTFLKRSHCLINQINWFIINHQ